MTRQLGGTTLFSKGQLEPNGRRQGRSIAMQDVKVRLDAWRAAERRRDGLPLGGSEWRQAEEDVRTAAKVFHAELARVSVRYAEAEFRNRNPWSTQSARNILGAGNPVAGAFIGRWPQR